MQDKTEKVVNFEENQTVLQVAELHQISLVGACDGAGICGGCHVIVENFSEKLQNISEQEEVGLDRVSGVTMKSRLACQIRLNKNLDGLIIKLVSV